MFRLCFVDHHGRQVWRNARDESERRRVVSRESRVGGECVLIVECEGADGICRGDDLWVCRPAGGKSFDNTEDAGEHSAGSKPIGSDPDAKPSPSRWHSFIVDDSKLKAAMDAKTPTEKAKIAELAQKADKTRKSRERLAMLRDIARGMR